MKLHELILPLSVQNFKMVPSLLVRVMLLFVATATATEYAVIVSKSNAELLGQYEGDAFLGFVDVKLNYRNEDRISFSPPFVIELDGRARHLWLQDIFTAYQLIPPISHLASFDDIGQIQADVIS